MRVILTYTGTGAYIMAIPARDLTDYDLENLAAERGVFVEDLIVTLEGSGIYEKTEDEMFACDVCGKEYKTWNGLHNHVVKEHQEPNPYLEDEDEDPPATENTETEE